MSRGGRAAAAALAALRLLAPVGHPAVAQARIGAAPDTGTATTVLDVPYVAQPPRLCGGAAVVMVMRYWGHDSADVASFAPLVDDSARGIRTDVLAGEVRRLGWRAVAFRGSLEELRRQLRRGRPVITLLKVGDGAYHYVVVVAVAAGGVLYHDPARAPFHRVSATDFLRAWAPTGAWSLLVVPPGTGVGALRAPPPASPDWTAAPTTPEASPRAAPGEGGACAAMVRDAIATAHRGDIADAASRLEAAAAACPGAAAPLRELAGVRFGQGRWNASAAAARRALELSPGDPYTVRVLAGDLYMQHRAAEALRVWNRIGEPRLEALRVYGLQRIRYRVVRRRAAVREGGLVTPGRLALTRRRLEAVPGLGAVRVGWAVSGQQGADVRVAVLERPPFPGGPPGLAVMLVAGLPERVLRVRTGSLLGDGESWTAAWRWWERRPRVSIGLRAPDALGVTGVWDVSGSWARQEFALHGLAGPAAAGSASAPAATTGPPPVREERWRAALSLSSWVAPDVRLEAGASLDRWSGAGAGPGVSVGGEVRSAGDRLRLAAHLAGWPGGPAGGFATASVEGDARSSPHPAGWVVGARAGVSAATRAAPLMVWPGAGAGYAGTALLRAHPLLDGGVLDAPAFGRTLAHGGADLERWTDVAAPLSLGVAAFVDVARAWHRPGDGAPGPGEADVGVGARVALPGAGGRLRVDFAHGLRDGANVLSVGWSGSWPGSLWSVEGG